MNTLRLLFSVCLYISLFFPGFYSSCWAETDLALNDPAARVDLNSSAQTSGFFVVPENLTPAQIINTLKHDRYQFQREMKPDFTRHSAFGLFAPIYNATQANAWVIHISRFLVDGADIHIQTGGNTTHYSYDFTHSGITQEFENIMGRGVPVTLNPGETAYLYIQISANSDVPPLYVGLMSRAKYTQWAGRFESVFNLCMGAILAFIITAFLGFSILRDSTLLWFGISSTFLVAMTVFRSHYGDDLIQTAQGGWPEWLPLFLAMTSVSLLMFAAKFLAIDEDSRWLARAFKVALVLSVLSGGLNMFLTIEASIKVAGLIGAITTILAIYAGMVKAVKHGRYYILFMLGWVPILLIVIGNLYTRFAPAEIGQSTLNYVLIQDMLFKVLHIAFHFSAIFVRVLDIKRQKLIFETQSKAKSTFLASISHDLRQPLHTMKLLLTQLESAVSSEQEKELISKLNQVHASTNETFSGLIDWSQLDAGRVNVCIEEVELDSVFNELRHEFIDLALNRNLQLRIRPTRLRLKTDPVLLKRILRNLLGNAIKYTASGGILLSVKRHRQEMIFEVWDTGCGIADAEQLSIFDLYERSSATKEASVGNGIGLANVKLIAEVLGFTVTLRSKLNKGSVFRIHVDIDGEQRASSAAHHYAEPTEISRLVYNYIAEPRLAQKVDKYLCEWGYTSVDPDNQPLVQVTPLLVLTDDLQRVKEDPGYVVATPIGLYVDKPSNETLEQHAQSYIYHLNIHGLPAELRAFIRYAESH